ncbi:MAG: hypothetical protein WEB00_02995 [Dehalococcoidia bacterium]
MTVSSGRSLPWLVLMFICLAAAVAAAALLVSFVLTDDDDDVVNALPIVGDDDDAAQFVRPEIEFVEIEDGDMLAAEPQVIEVHVSHPEGVAEVRFFVEGGTEVLNSQVSGSDGDAVTDTVVQFPFIPEETGEFVLVAEATATDGTVANPAEVSVTIVQPEDAPSEITPTATP